MKCVLYLVWLNQAVKCTCCLQTKINDFKKFLLHSTQNTAQWRYRRITGNTEHLLLTVSNKNDAEQYLLKKKKTYHCAATVCDLLKIWIKLALFFFASSLFLKIYLNWVVRVKINCNHWKRKEIIELSLQKLLICQESLYFLLLFLDI